ncbi:MAG: TM0996/MTH895 family glutaredoxin-like protein [Candidatus Krumholzibacteriota bacterium]|nr:TM0996/MTH895 family glutaredoxin-like protein [Candidatus Krumholzibacteriota bacterium]
MKTLQVLGTGCPKCEALTDNVRRAVAELDADCTIVKIKDIAEIMKFGVMMTPALAVDGEVKASGKVLSVDEIKALLA